MSQPPFFINPSCHLPANVTEEVCRAALAGYLVHEQSWGFPQGIQWRVSMGRAELCARFSLSLLALLHDTLWKWV